MNNERPILLKPKNIYFDIYKYLWLNTSPSSKINYKFRVSDTVLFLDDLPILWVFTAKDGSLKRKHPNKLNNSEISKHFLDNNKEIIGHYMFLTDENIEYDCLSKEDKEISEHLNFINEYFQKLKIVSEKKEVLSGKLIFEYLEKKPFENLLNNRKKRCGILQKYVKSINLKAYMYRVIWSPTISICDMKTARHKLDENVHIYEKLITFETEKFSNETSNYYFIFRNCQEYCGKEEAD
jgi:hypothetical protein